MSSLLSLSVNIVFIKLSISSSPESSLKAAVNANEMASCNTSAKMVYKSGELISVFTTALSPSFCL